MGISIPAEAIRMPMPSKPSWFDKELARCVPQYHGHPMFQIVNGMTEEMVQDGGRHRYLKYRNPEIECVSLEITYFTRFDSKTKKLKRYWTRKEAEDDKGKHLGELILEQKQFERRWVGSPCWIVEAYVAAEHFGTPEMWEHERWEVMDDSSGIRRRVDILGEYPKDGRYKYCFACVNDEGNAIEPGWQHIEEAKRLYMEVVIDKRSVSQRIKDDADRITKLDRKVKERLVDEFGGSFSDLTLKKLDGVAVSKPIRQGVI